jgi:hypothetical protein
VSFSFRSNYADVTGPVGSLSSEHGRQYQRPWLTGGTPTQWPLTVILYAGTNRTGLMTLQYQPGGYDDKALGGVVVQKLRKRGYL